MPAVAAEGGWEMTARNLCLDRQRVSPAAWDAVILIALVLGACNAKGKQTMKTNGEETLHSVGKEIGLTFPASAKLIGVHRERGVDDLIAVKVEMPAAEWPKFLASTPIDPALFSPGERGLLGPDQGFWTPHQASGLRTAEATTAQGRVLNLGYDDSHGQVVTVYVVNHGK
jgi:hypothetical protein